MQIVLAVHPAHDAAPLIRILAGLGFTDPAVDVVSVVEPITLNAPFSFGSASIPADVMTKIESATQAAADRVAAQIPGATTWVPCGDPAEEIKSRARALKADLVMTGSERKGVFGSLFFGSVTRGLALHGEASLFLVKQPDSDLSTMVFATDLSDYSQTCWRAFVGSRPGCLRKLHVITTVDVSAPNYGWLFPNMADFVSIPDPNIEELLGMQRERFAASDLPGVEVIHEIVSADAQNGLANAAAERRVGALILGGKGHSWADRVFIGSVALHHTMHGDMNLWLIRP